MKKEHNILNYIGLRSVYENKLLIILGELKLFLSSFIEKLAY